jgi:hypothetical protein
MKAKVTYILLLVFVLLSGCEQAFTPKGPYVQKLAVFGILSNNSDTQYVRVFKTYDPPGFNPYEVLEDQAVRGAEVEVGQGASVVRYAEAMIPRTDSSRFSDNILAYVAPKFRARPGMTYNLDVSTPSDGIAHASVTVPDTGWIGLLNPYALASNESEDLLAVQLRISSLTLGYMVRFYLQYDLLKVSTWVPMNMEMPGWMVIIDSTKYFGYPKLVRRSTTPGPRGTWQIEAAYFMPWAYRDKVAELVRFYGNTVRLRRIFFVLTQVEQNLYTFYNLANGYQDAISIRIDMPDWTNISGGIGLFGAMVEDTLFVEIPN